MSFWIYKKIRILIKKNISFFNDSEICLNTIILNHNPLN